MAKFWVRGQICGLWPKKKILWPSTTKSGQKSEIWPQKWPNGNPVCRTFSSFVSSSGLQDFIGPAFLFIWLGSPQCRMVQRCHVMPHWARSRIEVSHMKRLASNAQLCLISCLWHFKILLLYKTLAILLVATLPIPTLLLCCCSALPDLVN